MDNSFFVAFLCSIFSVFCTPDIPEKEIVDPESSQAASVDPTVSKYVPQAAWDNRRLYQEELAITFGNDDLLSVMGGQIFQEATWRCDLDSHYAVGCAQFTPDTMKWAAKSFCSHLGKPDPRDPEWAYRCHVQYVYWIHNNIKTYNTAHDRIALSLRGYNEGLGNTKKAQRKADDPGSVISVNLVSWKKPAFEKETDTYWQKIMYKWQLKYIEAGYGGKLI